MGAQLPIGLFTKKEDLFDKSQFPDDILQLLGPQLPAFIQSILRAYKVSDYPEIKGVVEEGAVIKGAVYIAQGSRVESGSYIEGPTYIGPYSQVRHGAYIRGNVYVGKDCVVGHATEVKSSVFLDGAKAGHFAYVGDSVLCQNCNLGAGTKLANLPFKRKPIRFLHPETKTVVDSGLQKFGAIIGDHAQTGCNSVLSPGSLMMPESFILPCEHFRGTKF